MQRQRYPGLHTQRHLRKGGVVREYYYYRPNRMKLVGQPGTPEFDASYKFARSFTKKRDVPKRHRQSVAAKQTRFVYFVQCVTLRHIKIGQARHPYTRFLNIQTSCPDDVVLLGVIEDTGAHAYRLEKVLQQRFASFRVRGEWYAEHDDLIAYIRENAVEASRRRVRYDSSDDDVYDAIDGGLSA